MKKIMTVLLIVLCVFAMVSCKKDNSAKKAETKIAMISDYGDITDQSFNQTTYEACKDYCDKHNIPFTYYKPTTDSEADRVGAIEQAINDGYQILVAPGYAFGGSISTVASTYPDVKFVGLDISEFDFTDAKVPANTYSMIYQEELCGYMAGYAAVKLGYTKLGFLGGMAVPAVVRYGYGFVQGANAAANGKSIEIKYAYGNQFYGDADITAAMDTWYKAGTECVFACGGGIYTSAAEAAAKFGGKVIGVDVDQAPIIDGAYGKGITVTSAMKGLYNSTQDALKKIVEENAFDSLKGKVATLGIKGGFVGIPEGAGTQFNSDFSLNDYKSLVADMESGKITVDNDISVDLSKVANVTFLGNLK